MEIYGTINTGTICVGYESLSIANVVQALTVPAEALSAFVVCEANTATTGVAVRFREDGTNPTATDGMPLNNFAVYEVRAGNLRSIRFISADAANIQTIRIEYYG